MSDDKERLAAWMMREGFATGHGDTAEQLLGELSWQVAEIKARRDELLEALEKMVRLFEPGRVYDFREVSALSSEALHVATTALTRASN
jgi:hypothetical protein